MIDWTLVAEIAGGGFGVTILVLVTIIGSLGGRVSNTKNYENYNRE